MSKTRKTDPVMQAVKLRWKGAKLTLRELGEKMGYAPELARQAAWQFLRTGDPHISMLRKFADALGISLQTLLRD